ncbi:pyridine nucleotide-disulfide oxidoreductase [Desulfosarcina widdelii]|uniref:Pyridine nucleotide-disulfide oxidoreductase n=1 Tax=Desulfosarcina widdelii TaxID=947919 RepID=A0A5K7Z1Q9_9BACT|nr:FAD-dependent oxidoreductase [Desulfosarcina widdelii]BBO74590.1 pyridine nucleotide-disulfide oxidoreductase [Desulfosarcina widdelii]
MGKHLVLIGGGHAHMVTLAKLHTFVEKGHRVTVIGPSDHHYYSGMGPGMLGRTYTPTEIRFATRHVVEKQGAAFIREKAVEILAGEKKVKLASGETVGYDFISFNAGSHVPRLDLPEDAKDVYAVKPIERLMEAQARILESTAQNKINIGILGGGPSSAEVSGNIWQLVRDAGGTMPHITIFAGKRFMSRFPDNVRSKVERSLTRRDIKINTSGYVKSVQSRKLTLSSNETQTLDLIFLAVGVKPNPIFNNSGLATGPDGGLRVNEFLQSVDYPEMFGGGDCIYFEKQPLDKVGVYAVRQNPVLYHNLMAALEDTPMQAFDPGGDYLLIFNLGGGKGVLRKRRLLFGGKIAFTVKDYIDRKFMKEFQAIE